MTMQQERLAPQDFERLVQDHLDEMASEADVALLRADEAAWVRTLFRLRDKARATLEDVRRKVTGPERPLVIADFESECRRIDEVLEELVGPLEAEVPEDEADAPEDAEVEELPGVVQLQLSWSPGMVVAWAAGPGTDAEDRDGVRERLRLAGAGAVDWQEHPDITLPKGKAPAVSAPLDAVMGWLVSLATAAGDGSGEQGADGDDPEAGDDRAEPPFGPSARWLGLAAAEAVGLVAQGRMVPQLAKSRRPRSAGDRPSDRTLYEVRWTPALVAEDRLARLAAAVPGAVTAVRPGERQDPRQLTAAVVGDLLDAICTTAAQRLPVPAPPPAPRSAHEVAEAFLTRLEGSAFEAPNRAGAELSRRLGQWARPVTASGIPTLVVHLDPPDEVDAWYLAVHAPTEDGGLEPVETALGTSGASRRRHVQDQLARLERLFPALRRPGGRRRGEVVLSQDEAWRLMTETGRALVAAGFDLRVPALSRRRPSPALRLTAEEAQESVVGASQLANVRWSVVFDDVELTAEEIRKLASEVRPLVRSRGRWIELDRADLAEAAAVLADRARTTQMTGAEMLRHALGLEGSPLAGGISLAGEGWAAELLRSASDVPEHPPTTLDGFEGELRSYQAEALAWLGFLDRAGLGGCLALDMGLGKTPTILAHMAATAGRGPALVVAPPAVVGNWAAEARRFTPGLRVEVHHGASRVDEADVPTMARRADVVLTTYGTAIRDIDALEQIEWSRVVLDEAQAIKNPASETAQQLRRIRAGTRVALTGTPIENGLGDLWAILDFANPGLVGTRAQFVSQLSREGDARDSAERALRALNGILVFRRTKAEPAIAAELPDRIDELDHCSMTPEQIGLYQAVIDELLATTSQETEGPAKKGAVLAAITALKQICNHPVAYQDDGGPLTGRSGKLSRLDEIIDNVFAAGERVLVFTHFASWGEKLAAYLTERTGIPIACYHGGLARGARDQMVKEFQSGTGPGALVLSLKAGGTGLNLTAASHVVLYDRWWNPAVEDQARDRVWRIGQTRTVICHRLVCPGTVDERVEEVVAGKRRIADLVLPKSSSVSDLDAQQLQTVLGIDTDALLVEEPEPTTVDEGEAA